MAKKMKPIRPKKRRKSMGGSSSKWTARQKEALRRLNQDFNW
jgi:hypothetical protein